MKPVVADAQAFHAIQTTLRMKYPSKPKPAVTFRQINSGLATRRGVSTEIPPGMDKSQCTVFCDAVRCSAPLGRLVLCPEPYQKLRAAAVAIALMNNAVKRLACGRRRNPTL